MSGVPVNAALLPNGKGHITLEDLAPSAVRPRRRRHLGGGDGGDDRSPAKGPTLASSQTSQAPKPPSAAASAAARRRRSPPAAPHHLPRDRAAQRHGPTVVAGVVQVAAADVAAAPRTSYSSH